MGKKSNKRKRCQKTESFSGQSEANKSKKETAPLAEAVESPTPPKTVVEPDKSEVDAVPSATSSGAGKPTSRNEIHRDEDAEGLESYKNFCKTALKNIDGAIGDYFQELLRMGHPINVSSLTALEETVEAYFDAMFLMPYPYTQA